MEVPLPGRHVLHFDIVCHDVYCTSHEIPCERLQRTHRVMGNGSSSVPPANISTMKNPERIAKANEPKTVDGQHARYIQYIDI